jgi:hypothetical protein
MTGDVMFDQKNCKASPAQALVEVAILLPMLLLLILGAMDFGRMFFTKIALTNVAREGANYLTYYPEDKNTNYTATYALINDEISNSGFLDSSLVTTDPPVNCCTRGNYVEITVRITDIPLIFGGLYRQFLPDGTLDLASTVRMMVQ